MADSMSHNSIFQKLQCLLPSDMIRTCPDWYVGLTATNPMTDSERNKQNCQKFSSTSCLYSASLDFLKLVADNKCLAYINRKRTLQNPLRSQQLSD